MAKLLYPDFFNDVFGPIMQPGSSGGFAGPCRIGNIAHALIKEKPKRIRFVFDESHDDLAYLVNFMTDRGYLAGSLGFSIEDERVFDAHEIARKEGVCYSFEHATSEYRGPRPIDGVHIEIEDEGGNKGELTAASVGGGMIQVSEVNGFRLDWQADTYGLMVEGLRQVVIERFETFKNHYQDHVVDSYVLESVHDQSSGQALFIELSTQPTSLMIAEYFDGCSVVLLPALLPVVSTLDRKPQLFSTVEEWSRYAYNHNVSFVQAAIDYERAFSGWSEQRILDYFEKIASILDRQIHALEDIGYDQVADTAMLPVYGRQWNEYLHLRGSLSDPLTEHILRHSFSVNAKIPGVRIVPGPMGTGGGYLFAALDAVREHHGYSHEKVIEGLIVAAGLGALAYTHTNASGEVGCVGESGVCCAMAAGAITWLAGGTGEQVERAASMALQASIGITCDPIVGGLEFPCITRTLRAATSAVMYADLALSGIDPLIPYHEMLQAIEAHFQATSPELLYGNACGCNVTPTAHKCMKRVSQ